MALQHSLRDLQATVEIVAGGFNRSWSATSCFVDLVEEVGELANALLVATDQKDRKRQKSELTESAGDVAFSLLMFCAASGVDLEGSLVSVIADIQDRQQRSEFG